MGGGTVLALERGWVTYCRIYNRVVNLCLLKTVMAMQERWRLMWRWRRWSVMGGDGCGGWRRWRCILMGGRLRSSTKSPAYSQQKSKSRFHAGCQTAAEIQ